MSNTRKRGKANTAWKSNFGQKKFEQLLSLNFFRAKIGTNFVVFSALMDMPLRLRRVYFDALLMYFEHNDLGFVWIKEIKNYKV